MARVALERQLERLAECGIEIASLALAWCVSEWGRDKLESDPELVLSSIGHQYQDASGAWRPGGVGVWYLDTECIYDASDYVNVVRALASLTRGDIAVANIEAEFGETAWVRFEANGDRVYWELEVNDDWIDTSLIERFAGLLQNAGSERRFYASQSDTQDFLLICPTPAEFGRLTTLTPTRFAEVG